MYYYVVLPLGRSISGVLADVRKDSRFAESKVICSAREGDQLAPPPEAVLTVAVRPDGTLSKEDQKALDDRLNQVYMGDGDDRVAFIANGGTTPQTWVICRLASANDGAYREAFDVQRDKIVQLADPSF
jgi:hypothetical protein